MKTTAQLVSIRAGLFVGLTALSVPLAFPLGMAVLVPLSQLAPSPLPDTAFWHWVDDFVFDLPVKWSYVVLAPGFPNAIVFWAIIAIAYGWLTRRIRLSYAGLGVLPVVWVIGIATHIAIDSYAGPAAASSANTSIPASGLNQLTGTSAPSRISFTASRL